MIQYALPPGRFVPPHEVRFVVGHRLHELRLEAEVTVHQLAFRAGHMKPELIRYYEAGKLQITLPVLARLAHALELDVIDLLWDLRHPPPRPTFRRPRSKKRLRG